MIHTHIRILPPRGREDCINPMSRNLSALAFTSENVLLNLKHDHDLILARKVQEPDDKKFSHQAFVA